MTPCFARSRLVAVLLVSVFSAQAQVQPTPTPLPTNPTAATPAPGGRVDDPLVQLKLPDADIDTVLSTLEIFTGRTVLRTAGLPTTNYNLKIVDPIPKSQAIVAIETVLMLNNVGVSKLGDRFLVVTVLPVAKNMAPELINGSAFDLPTSGKIAVKVFQLDFLRAQELSQLLSVIINPNLAMQPMIFPNANAIMVTDSVANLQRIEALLQQLDKPSLSGMKPKFYPLTNASAAGVVNKLRSILQGTLTQQLGTATTYQADERTNQIILITDPRQYPFFDDLIAKLDVKADPNTRNEVIYLKHATAQKLNDVLSLIIRGQASAQQRQQSQGGRQGQNNAIIPPNQPNVPGAPNVAPAPINANAALAAAALEGTGNGSAEFSQVLTLAYDERSNSIVVSGTIDDIRLITALIDKLDTVLAQVRIEVVIAEVSLDDSHSSGISQLGLQIEGDRLVGIAGSTTGLTIGGATDGSFATTSRIGGPGSLGRSLDLTAVIGINSTPRKNNTTVLSVPSITTSHAKPATIISSEKRPITTGTTSTPVASTGSSGFSTQQQVVQQDIGITLTVTPLIGVDGSVQLDIDQDVQDVAGTVLVNGDEQPIISHRQAKTTISAKSGDIVVIGGLQRNKDTRQTNRLGPIPIIGDIFGSRTKGVTRTELIFFLRPYVLTNTPADNTEMLSRLQDLPAKEVPQKNQIIRAVDPTYVPPAKSGVLDKILPR